MVKVFIDGREGTTGLQIYERLAKRSDVELILLDDALRKDECARREALNSAEVVFLCLPDDAARQAVSMVTNPSVRVIDASTAHRTAEGWTYGFAELSKDWREQVKATKRLSNCGCHAVGAVALIRPLKAAGIIGADYPLAIHSVTGYSGGGKKMIADYQNPNRATSFDAPSQYATGQTHKHLAEIKKYALIDFEPLFSPIVADYYCGMSVTVPLFSRLFAKKASIADIKEVYAEYYEGSKLIEVGDMAGAISANAYADTDKMLISVGGTDGRIIVNALFDNLGKGASGSAVQCFNLMTGANEEYSLKLTNKQ